MSVATDGIVGLLGGGGASVASLLSPFLEGVVMEPSAQHEFAQIFVAAEMFLLRLTRLG